MRIFHLNFLFHFLFFIYNANFHLVIIEKMAANIREEIRRLHRRKQLHFNPQGNTSGCDSSDMEGPASPAATGVNATSYSPNNKEKPLFTFRQVSAI